MLLCYLTHQNTLISPPSLSFIHYNYNNFYISLIRNLSYSFDKMEFMYKGYVRRKYLSICFVYFVLFAVKDPWLSLHKILENPNPIHLSCIYLGCLFKRLHIPLIRKFTLIVSLKKTKKKSIGMNTDSSIICFLEQKVALYWKTKISAKVVHWAS